VIYYIHANPELHGIISDFRKYKWSSYQSFLSEKPSFIPKGEILKWFRGFERFKGFHTEKHDVRNGEWGLE